MATKKLTLRREHVAELSVSELESVNGASGLPCYPLTSICPSFDGCTGCYPWNCG